MPQKESRPVAAPMAMIGTAALRQPPRSAWRWRMAGPTATIAAVTSIIAVWPSAGSTASTSTTGWCARASPGRSGATPASISRPKTRRATRGAVSGKPEPRRLGPIDRGCAGSRGMVAPAGRRPSSRPPRYNPAIRGHSRSGSAGGLIAAGGRPSSFWPRATIRSAPSGNGRCKASASFAGPAIQTSISS